MVKVLTTDEYQELEKKHSIIDEMDVIFKDEGRFLQVKFLTSKAIDCANIRFPKQLEIIGDHFAINIPKGSKLPMSLWCKENELKTFDF